ncbi:MAG: hypothetical protein EXR75_06465 [Myxococcales bacterium]|nr:hypothetical protein [Myxococcales bacterium]
MSPEQKDAKMVLQVVGAIKRNRLKSRRLYDFNPLENLAYIGGVFDPEVLPPKPENQDWDEDEVEVENEPPRVIKELGFPAGNAPTTAGDDEDLDKHIIKFEGKTPSPNAGPPLETDPGNSTVNASKFPRRKLATWVHVAVNEEFGGQQWQRYEIFKPDSFSSDYAKITLLFGVGDDLYRHGVRHYLEATSDRIIIVVPGTEGYEWMHTRRVRGVGFKHKHWAVGITCAQIERLLSRAGVTALWEIDILAAFSTGYRGLYATIMNTRGPNQAMDSPTTTSRDVVGAAETDDTPSLPSGTMLGPYLRNVKRLVVFDCLYRDDMLKIGTPNKLGDVLTRLTELADLRNAKKPIEFLLYDATTAGSSRALRPFDTQFKKLSVSDDVRDTYQLDLRFLRKSAKDPASPESVEWLAVIMSRLLKEALHDETIDPTVFDKRLGAPHYRGAKDVIKAMIARIGTDEWKRGNITSAATAQGGRKSFRDFLQPAERVPFTNIMNLLLRDFITPYKLLGWFAWNLGEVAHDGLLVEFAWEGLVGATAAAVFAPPPALDIA